MTQAITPLPDEALVIVAACAPGDPSFTHPWCHHSQHADYRLAVETPVTQRSSDCACLPWAREAGLPNLTLHQVRHGAASLMLAHDVPLKTVQETLGHSTIAITADIYGHVVMELKRPAADAIDAAMGKATPKTGPQRTGSKGDLNSPGSSQD
ncbi:MAG: tyrosine-type recombinase/integrase [Actinobacteria bacterium]|nr:tyrosine-type recombinase/integrase [Actinomycetota bacterium]